MRNAVIRTTGVVFIVALVGCSSGGHDELPALGGRHDTTLNTTHVVSPSTTSSTSTTQVQVPTTPDWRVSPPTVLVYEPAPTEAAPAPAAQPQPPQQPRQRRTVPVTAPRREAPPPVTPVAEPPPTEPPPPVTQPPTTEPPKESRSPTTTRPPETRPPETEPPATQPPAPPTSG